ncbi:hypothetical protein JOF53_000358 [Crossiella equi]|uniref:Uncharacterized protein n=1 Tax=Crossiella equi TaxID=130796 RepID=A0ABS5A599_9PSEU|nr:hypothetical protein [Crossiella equi]MBP2471486.1 hypothetical protein [Crossiella equi]
MTSLLTRHDPGQLRPVPHVADWAPTGHPTPPGHAPAPGAVGTYDGVPYTVDPAAPRLLRAQGPGPDIPLGPTPLPLAGVRGGLVTPHGRVLLVADAPNAVFCFDLLHTGAPHPYPYTGICTGARPLPELSSPATGLVLRSWWSPDGDFLPLHVLTADGRARALAVADPVEL